MNSLQKLKFVLSTNFYTESAAGDGLNAVQRCQELKLAWSGKDGFQASIAKCIRAIKDKIDQSVRQGTIQGTTVTHSFVLDNWFKAGSDFPSCSAVFGDFGIAQPGAGAGAASVIKNLIDEHVISQNYTMSAEVSETHESTIRRREAAKLKCELLKKALEKEKQFALNLLDKMFAAECPKKSAFGGPFKSIKDTDGKQGAIDKLNAYYTEIANQIGDNNGYSKAPYNGSFCADSKPQNAPGAGGDGQRPERGGHGGFR